MNSKIIISTVVGVVIVGGVAAYMFMGKGTMMRDTNSDLTSQQGKATSMKSLLTSTSPQKCTFSESIEGDNAASSGTVYVASGKMRGDFESLVAGKSEKSHMIVVDNTSHVWSDSMSQGFKMSLTEIEKPTAGKQNQIDINKEVAYSCSAWSVDASLFVPPSNITFSDMNAMMKDIPAMNGIPPNNNPMLDDGGPMRTSQCGACDSLPGEQKTQCRAALSC